MNLRELAIAACNNVIPSNYGEDTFDQTLCQGHFQAGYGSTCGFLWSYVLEQIGNRSPEMLNRDEPDYGITYGPGENISRPVSGAKSLGCWRTLSDGPPSQGDLIFWSNGPSNTEHVEVFDSDDGTSYHCYAAGQTNGNGQQCAKYITRAKIGTTQGGFFNGPRTMQGYISLDAVPIAIDNTGFQLSTGAFEGLSTTRKCLTLGGAIGGFVLGGPIGAILGGLASWYAVQRF